MGLLQSITDWFVVPDSYPGVERKDGVVTHTPTRGTNEQIEQRMAQGALLQNVRLSAVAGCVRVISEGLALPPCFIHREVGDKRVQATNHPLYELLRWSPNDRQTSYEFREQIGRQLALDGNAYVFINRGSDGSVLELLPCEGGVVSIMVDTSQLWAEPVYYLFGRPVPRSQIWHLKGPAWHSWQGLNAAHEMRDAVGLASATERYGQTLFINGARPGGLIAPTNGGQLTRDQAEQLKAEWSANQQGVNNANKTLMLTGPVSYTPIGHTAEEAQFLETRKFQIEEICRHFRVGPTKIFQQLGSHSYASVEQAHIAHDQDTDAHWQQRFVQSATKHLLSDAERRAGYRVTIDNREVKRGATAAERMTYWVTGVSNGLFSQNEARMAEGFDPSDDPAADKLMRAANLAGLPKPGSQPPVADAGKES